MPFNGSGVFAATASSFNPAVADTVIDESDWNDLLTEIETALTLAICKDGQSTCTGSITFAAGVKINNTGLKVLDTNASHTLAIVPGSNLTANKTLTLTTGDADRTVTISGDATISQDYSTAGTPRLNRLGLGVDADATTVLRVTQGTAASTVASLSQSNATPGATTIGNFTFGAASPDDNTAIFINGTDSTTTRFRVYSDGDVQNEDNSYGAISDEKLKQDIIDAGSQWDDVKAMRLRKYRMITDVEKGKEHVQLGLVAQELERSSPGLVRDYPDREEYDVPAVVEGGKVVEPAKRLSRLTGDHTKGIVYSVVNLKVLGALQEAMARIEALEAKAGV